MEQINAFLDNFFAIISKIVENILNIIKMVSNATNPPAEKEPVEDAGEA